MALCLVEWNQLHNVVRRNHAGGDAVKDILSRALVALLFDKAKPFVQCWLSLS